MMANFTVFTLITKLLEEIHHVSSIIANHKMFLLVFYKIGIIFSHESSN